MKNLPTTGDTIWTCIDCSGYAISTTRPRGKYNLFPKRQPHRGLKGQQEPRSSCYGGAQQTDSLSPSPLSSKRIISHVFKRELEAQMSLNRTSPCHHITFSLIAALRSNLPDASASLKLTVLASGRKDPGKPFRIEWSPDLLLLLLSFQRMEDAWRELERVEIRLLTCWHLNRI